jgi:hypothetical protein
MKKVKGAIFLLLFTDFKKTIRKNFGQKMRKIFIMLSFFKNFTNSKIKVWTQILPQIDKNDFYK